TKTLGAGWTGEIIIDVIDPVSGQTYEVKFDRPEEITVFARFTVRQSTVDAQTIIPSAVRAYADGELNGDSGLTTGTDVSPFELSGAVNIVEPRIFVQKVELSTDGTTWVSSDVPIALNQI